MLINMLIALMANTYNVVSSAAYQEYYQGVKFKKILLFYTVMNRLMKWVNDFKRFQSSLNGENRF